MKKHLNPIQKVITLLISLFLFQVSFSQEAVIFDSVMSITEAEKGFEYFQPDSNAGTNWITPYDYYNGHFEIRYEVLEYIANTTMVMQTCIWSEVVGQWESWKENCSPRVLIPGKGVVTSSSVPKENWWKLNNVPVDFSNVDLFLRMGLVLWCDYNHNLSPWVPEEESCWDERKSYLPMKARLSIVAVADGYTFSGWDKFLMEHVYISEPYYNIQSATYNKPQKIYMGTITSGAEIRYTLDNTMPTDSSTLYTDSIEIDMPSTIIARSFKDGHMSTFTTNLTLNFKVDSPDIIKLSEENGQVTVSMNTTLDGAEIRYNLNSSENPDTTSNLYTEPIKVDYNTKIKARAYKKGWRESAISLHIVTPTSIRVIDYTDEITTYPNPLSDKLTIELGNVIFDKAQVTITNILGNIVKTEVIDKTITHLDVSFLTQGAYILQITQGNKNFAQIMIKQ